MKNQERSDNIKKFLITLMLILIPTTVVNATESDELYPDVTNDIEIRYKWYKEVISSEGEYYPLKDIKGNDIIDEFNIKYMESSVYKQEYCSLQADYYLLEEKYEREYQTLSNASYILIDNVNSSTNIKIYYEYKPINFTIMSNNNNQIKINIRKPYACDKLIFYVDTDEKYTIGLYKDLSFQKKIISKTIENEIITKPDETWIDQSTKFNIIKTEEEKNETSLTKLISETKMCSYKEKYVYKYNKTKEYYDDNYHLNVEGYTKDENDYRYFYKGKPITITNTVEIIKEKIVKEPQIKYVYIEKETEQNKDDSSKENTCPENTKQEIKTEIKTEIIEKNVFKTPKKIYIILIILVIIILILTIKLYRKYVE